MNLAEYSLRYASTFSLRIFNSCSRFGQGDPILGAEAECSDI